MASAKAAAKLDAPAALETLLNFHRRKNVHVQTRRALSLLALTAALLLSAPPSPVLADDGHVVFKAGEFISRRPPGRWRTINVDRGSGVTVHDEKRAWSGLNFYVSGDEPGAVLMDMDGNVLHRWTCTLDKAWPEWAAESRDRNAGFWRSAHLFDNGDVLAVFDGLGLVMLDKDSNVIWTKRGGEHHEVAVSDDGTIYALTKEPAKSKVLRPGADILENYVVALDRQGNEIMSASLLKAFLRSDFLDAIKGLQIFGDIFDVNSISVLSDGMVDGLPQFKSGSVLLSLRIPNMLAVMDLDLMEVTWIATGAWVGQHDPSVLPDGNILLFDNKGNDGRSRLIEFDPVTGEQVWTYEGKEPDDFSSESCGAVERLPNGNTLATESDRGRAVEIAPDGTVVWEYLNPVRAGSERQLIATIFEMERLPPDAASGWQDTAQ